MTSELQQLHKDMEELKKEVCEIRDLLLHEPELREDIIEQIKKARKEIKNNFVTHEQMMKEFAR